MIVQQQLPSTQAVIKSLAEKIKTARLLRGYTQNYLANSCSISRSTLQSIEKGSSEVSIAAYLKVMNMLDFQIELQVLAEIEYLPLIRRLKKRFGNI